MIACVFCPATEPSPLAALAHGWTSRTLDQPVTYRSAFGEMPPTPAGEHNLCPACAAWLTDHRDRMLPIGVLDAIDATLDAQEEAEGVAFHPTTARRLRLELIGMARHLAEALTPEVPR